MDLIQLISNPTDREPIFRALAEKTSAAILILEGWVIRYANPSTEALTGFDQGELFGKDVRELTVPADHPVLERLSQPREPSTHHQPERLKWICRDGFERMVEVTGAHISIQGAQALILTAFSLHGAEEVGEAREDGSAHTGVVSPGRGEELEAVIISLNEAVVIYDRVGNPVRANPAAVKAYGLDPVSMDRHSLIQTLKIRRPDGETLSLEDAPVSRALRGDTITAETLILDRVDGSQLIAVVSAAPIRVQAEITGAVIIWRDITEREQLLAQLEAEQGRLQAIIRSAPDAILIADSQGQVVLKNPAADLMFGQRVSSSGAENSRLDVRLRRPDGALYKPEEMPLTRSALEALTFTNIELLVDRLDGTHYSLLGSTGPIFDRKGLPTGSIGVFQDITDRKRAEDAVKREASRLELLAALSQSFAEAGLYYPAVLSTIAERVAETIGDACIIRLVSDDGQWLDPVAFHHIDPEAFSIFRHVLHATRKRVDEGMAGHVYQTGQPLIVLDMTLDELSNLDHAETLEWLKKNPVQNALFVPLRAQDRLIGTLSIIRSLTKKPYSIEDQVFAQDLADRAALAIENARLYATEAQRVRELDALHKAASALLSTLDLESLLGQILDAAQNAIPAAENGLLHLAAPGTGELKVRAMLGYSDPRIQKMGGHNDQAFLATAVRQRKPLLVHDTRAGDLKGQAAGSAAVRSAIVAPLILDNRVLGVLSLSSPRPSAFADADLRLLVSLAATTTAAIQNALLHTEVQRMAITDALTEQYNRRGFDELGRRELDRFLRFGRPLSVIMLDIDHFKNVNDAHGHAVGDQVLMTLARRCRSHVRHVDILGRLGGEEFAILLPETDLFTASEIAERIRRSVADEVFATSQGPVSISVSLGVSKAVPTMQELDELIGQADSALYKAKQNGRNRVEIG